MKIENIGIQEFLAFGINGITFGGKGGQKRTGITQVSARAG